MNQPDGQPKISVIRDGQGSAMATEDTTGRTTGMSKVDGDMKPISVSTLVGKNLYNLEGDVLGDVEYVVDGANGQTSVVIGLGCFLGMGEKQVAVALDKIFMKRDRLVTRGRTDDQIRAMPAWKKGDAKELGGSHMVKVDTKA
ncbi:PRC-barrel domain-containing protein [Methylobacterium sp. J-088]|uniref:PRC-barrel domain-containing protein n=1 Tax=Methylobacterium sp. J-088 TaxID=2836664 RepID=UPI001FB93ADB|nr:PRC-barrel domain-containing protein [Methylobacterium sp. J-088]MCJ2062755.1 PRC-barrel domain-containing protein [Methylobacterium sp. J-088]